MRIKQLFSSVDTHTEGGPTRIVTSGIPPLRGASLAEKRDDFKARHDRVRECLINYPRGYPGMFGAVLTAPTRPDADIGAFFLTNSGYLDMCVHSAMGVAAACLEMGMVTPRGQENLVRLETPSGIICLWPAFAGNDLESVAIEPAPAFVHTETISLDMGLDAPVSASIVFSAVFFVLMDVGKIGVHVTGANAQTLRALACRSIEKANQALNSGGLEPAGRISVDLALLYENIDATCCISAVYSKSGILDRSPCGAGTAAKMTLMHQRGELDQNKDYTNRSIFNTKFKGRVTRSQVSGQENRVWSIISGSAHITGWHQFVIDAADELHA